MTKEQPMNTDEKAFHETRAILPHLFYGGESLKDQTLALHTLYYIAETTRDLITDFSFLNARYEKKVEKEKQLFSTSECEIHVFKIKRNYSDVSSTDREILSDILGICSIIFNPRHREALIELVHRNVTKEHFDRYINTVLRPVWVREDIRDFAFSVRLHIHIRDFHNSLIKMLNISDNNFNLYYEVEIIEDIPEDSE